MLLTLILTAYLMASNWFAFLCSCFYYVYLENTKKNKWNINEWINAKVFIDNWLNK